MTFQEWLGEIEAWSTREERLISDHKGWMTYETLIKWLQSAYLVGYDAGKEDDHYDGH
jgi:hypothetical protein